jgi:hypothetical protein
MPTVLQRTDVLYRGKPLTCGYNYRLRRDGKDHSAHIPYGRYRYLGKVSIGVFRTGEPCEFRTCLATDLATFGHLCGRSG